MKKLLPLIAFAFLSLSAFAQSKQPLCFTAEEPNASVQIKTDYNNPSSIVSLEISRDGETWTEYSIGNTINLENVGDKVYFRNSLDTPHSFSASDVDYYSFFTGYDPSPKIAVSGNVMSLIDKTCELKSLAGYDYAFERLFNYCSNLTSAPELPATVLSAHCYENMFSGCKSLKKAPELPATEMKEYCYQCMFANCHELTEMPKLPAKKLAKSCYENFMRTCTKITESTELPATEMAENCYAWMFIECSNLKKAPALPAKKLAANCYYGMFTSCTNLTEASELPAMELANCCYLQMYQKCSNLEKTPDLPATKLASSCYNYMFTNCTKLTTIPDMPAKELIGPCYTYMFSGCTSLVVNTSGVGKPWSIPEGTTSIWNNYYDCCREGMFNGTGGDVKTPEIGVTYYIASDIAYIESCLTAFKQYKWDKRSKVGSMVKTSDGAIAYDLMRQLREDIDAMEYDSSLSLADNEAKVDALLKEFEKELAAIRATRAALLLNLNIEIELGEYLIDNGIVYQVYDLQMAIDEASKVADDEDATPLQIQLAANDMSKALSRHHGLIRATLYSLLEIAADIINHTPNYPPVLYTAAKEGNKVYNNPLSTESDYANAIITLSKAIPDEAAAITDAVVEKKKNGKFIENGRIVIITDNSKYNANGQKTR